MLGPADRLLPLAGSGAAGELPTNGRPWLDTPANGRPWLGTPANGRGAAAKPNLAAWWAATATKYWTQLPEHSQSCLWTTHHWCSAWYWSCANWFHNKSEIADVFNLLIFSDIYCYGGFCIGYRVGFVGGGDCHIGGGD